MGTRWDTGAAPIFGVPVTQALVPQMVRLIADIEASAESEVPFFSGGVLCQAAEEDATFPGVDKWREYIQLDRKPVGALRRLERDDLDRTFGCDMLMFKMMLAAAGRLMDRRGFAACRPVGVAYFHRSILEVHALGPQHRIAWNPMQVHFMLLGWYNAAWRTFDFALARRATLTVELFVFAGDRKVGPRVAAGGSSDAFLIAAAQRAMALGGRTAFVSVAARVAIDAKRPAVVLEAMSQALRGLGASGFAGLTGDRVLTHAALARLTATQVEAIVHDRGLAWLFGSVRGFEYAMDPPQQGARWLRGGGRGEAPLEAEGFSERAKHKRCANPNTRVTDAIMLEVADYGGEDTRIEEMQAEIEQLKATRARLAAENLKYQFELGKQRSGRPEHTGAALPVGGHMHHEHGAPTPSLREAQAGIARSQHAIVHSLQAIEALADEGPRGNAMEWERQKNQELRALMRANIALERDVQRQRALSEQFARNRRSERGIMEDMRNASRSEQQLFQEALRRNEQLMESMPSDF